KVVQPLAGSLVAAIGQPAPSLQERRGAEKAIAVPPMTRATRGTAEAKDAFVIAVDLASFLRRLESLPFGLRGLGFEPRLDCRILREEMREIWDQILDDPQVRQRIDCRRRGQVENEPRAGKPVRAIDVHCAGAANPLATRTAERQRRIDLVLDPDERIKNHRPAIVEVHSERVQTRVFAGIWIVAIDLEFLDAGRAVRRRPRPSTLDARFRGDAEIPGYRKPLEQGGARDLIRGFDDHSVLTIGLVRQPKM